MNNAVEIAKTLWQIETAREKRAFCPKDLHHAARPANALPHMSRQTAGGQTGCLRNSKVRRIPTKALQPQSCVRVLCHRFNCNTANLFECFAPDNRAGAAEESGIPKIVSV